MVWHSVQCFLILFHDTEPYRFHLESKQMNPTHIKATPYDDYFQGFYFLSVHAWRFFVHVTD